MSLENTERFSGRAQWYRDYRPGYPPALADLLIAWAELTPASVVADTGAGSGLSSELFLKAGVPVWAVEPNADMRMAAEARLRGYPGFRSIAATAEATTLPDNGADLVVAGTAFHWFDRDRARAEFTRIAKPPSRVALFWNVRAADRSPFLAAYEDLLRRLLPEYRGRSREKGSSVTGFFPGDSYEVHFANQQMFDFPGLMGRVQSSSYAPLPGTPLHEALEAELRKLFDDHAEDGRITFLYDTVVYYGCLQ